MRETLGLKWQELAVGHCGMFWHYEYQVGMGRTSMIYATYIIADGKEEKDGQKKDKESLFLRVKS